MVNSVLESGAASASEIGDAAQKSDHSAVYKGYITVVLALVALFAAVDRNILSVLLVPIQKDLGVSDTAMGALTGVAFSLVYATAALPLARLADKTNRRNLLALAVAFWSAMTALCGLAGNFVQLLLARIGVAAGEAAQSPSTMSMLADFFPPTRRGGAISVLTIGSALGFAAGAAVAGALNDRYGWHIAMMAVGLPGLLLAALIFFTVPEPRRGSHDAAAQDAPLGLLAAYKRLLKIRTLAPLLMGMIFLNIAFMGWLTWLPAFLMRLHHLTTTQMSAIFGIVVGVGAVVANVFAGVASDRLEKKGSRYRMYFCVVMILVGVPLLTAGTLINATPLAVGFMMAYTLASGGLTTVTAASVLSIAPPTLRASAVAFIGLAVTVFGGGVGPLLIGAVNDMLKGAYGEAAVRYTLLSAPVGLLLAAACFFIASRTIDHDVKEATGGAPAGPAPRLH